MWLPPGTIRALHRYPDAIFYLAVACLAFGALIAHAAGWATIVIVLVVLGAYDRRRSAAEAHERKIAEQKLEMSVSRVEAIKARHLDVIAQVQPDLPLGPVAGKVTTRRRGK